MASYSYPEMPLKANVWHGAAQLPPVEAPDRLDVPCSLSPISPIQALTGLINDGVYRQLTHIIRTATDPGVTDNYMRGDERDLVPVGVYEIPAGSGHLYKVIWAHIVGAGFANEHHRIYACRWTTGLLADLPWFRGWI